MGLGTCDVLPIPSLAQPTNLPSGLRAQCCASSSSRWKRTCSRWSRRGSRMTVWSTIRLWHARWQYEPFRCFFGIPNEGAEVKAAHLITLRVQNHVGTLNRLVSMFRRRSYSINSLTAGDCEEEGCSRLTLVVG